MSHGTPRKFSEKIAIIERKLNEDAEAFGAVMRDVRAITSFFPQNPSTPSIGVMPHQELNVPSFWSEVGGRPGGSLPNVNGMVHHNQPQQQQQQQQCSPIYMDIGDIWPIQPSSSGHLWSSNQQQQQQQQQQQRQQRQQRVMHAAKDRSPGAHLHFHPYKQLHTMTNVGQHHHQSYSIQQQQHHVPINIFGNLLQPPDAQWRKAHSDPQIHAHAHGQLDASSQDNFASSSSSVNELTSPVNASSNASIPGAKVFSQDVQLHFDPDKDVQNQMNIKLPGSSFDSLSDGHQIHAQPKIDTIACSSSTPGGSLPNFPLQRFPAPTTEHFYPSFCGRDISARQNQSTLANSAETEALLHAGFQALTPRYCVESQSAPTSPGDQSKNGPSSSNNATYELQNQLQGIRLHSNNVSVTRQNQSTQQGWYQQAGQQQQQQQLTRNFDDMTVPSPNSGQIPNIVLTGTDGSVSEQQENLLREQDMDCFQYLQDMRLDSNELQQLLSDNSNQVDPAIEHVLRLDHD